MDPFAEISMCYEAGGPLPGLAYRDTDVFDAEIARIFRSSWIGLTCGQNVPNTDDLFPVQIAGQSLFVARDEEGQIRVFYNLCRHRGARLVDEPCNARGGRITCPYHAWAYGTDGKLRSAPHLHRGEKKGPLDQSELDRLGLIPVRSAVWRDIIFADLSGEAEPFEDFIRPLTQRVSHWTESELRPLGSDEYEIQANWKLAAENFLDTYHLPVVHSQLGGGYTGALLIEDVVASRDIIGVVMPINVGLEPVEGDLILPRFSGLAEDEQRRLELFAIFPNTLLIVEADFQQVIVLRPQSVGVTSETFADYVVSDAALAEPLAEEMAEARKESIEINDQDAVLLAALQQTRTMDVAGQTVPIDSWDTTPQRFQRLWASKLLGAREARTDR